MNTKIRNNRRGIRNFAVSAFAAMTIGFAPSPAHARLSLDEYTNNIHATRAANIRTSRRGATASSDSPLHVYQMVSSFTNSDSSGDWSDENAGTYYDYGDNDATTATDIAASSQVEQEEENTAAGDEQVVFPGASDDDQVVAGTVGTASTSNNNKASKGKVIPVATATVVGTVVARKVTQAGLDSKSSNASADRKKVVEAIMVNGGVGKISGKSLDDDNDDSEDDEEGAAVSAADARTMDPEEMERMKNQEKVQKIIENAKAARRQVLLREREEQDEFNKSISSGGFGINGDSGNVSVISPPTAGGTAVATEIETTTKTNTVTLDLTTSQETFESKFQKDLSKLDMTEILPTVSMSMEIEQEEGTWGKGKVVIGDNSGSGGSSKGESSSIVEELGIDQGNVMLQRTAGGDAGGDDNNNDSGGTSMESPSLSNNMEPPTENNNHDDNQENHDLIAAATTLAQKKKEEATARALLETRLTMERKSKQATMDTVNDISDIEDIDETKWFQELEDAKAEAEEEARLAEEAEEEARLAEEQAAKLKEEAKALAAEEERLTKAEEEARVKAEAAEEEARQAEEARARAEEEARLAEEAKATAKAEEEARLVAEEEAKAKAEEEARVAEEEAKAEEEARFKAEEEVKAKAEEEARVAEEAKAKAEAAKKAKEEAREQLKKAGEIFSALDAKLAEKELPGATKKAVTKAKETVEAALAKEDKEEKEEGERVVPATAVEPKATVEASTVEEKVETKKATSAAAESVTDAVVVEIKATEEAISDEQTATSTSSSSAAIKDDIDSSSNMTSSRPPVLAQIPVNEYTVEFTSGLLGGAVGLALGGPAVGALVAATANYASRMKDGSTKAALQVVSTAVIEAYNFLVEVESRFRILAQTQEALKAGIDKLKENENFDREAVEAAEKALAETGKSIVDLNERYDLVNAGLIVLATIGDIVEKAITSTGELDEEYKISERAKKSIMEAMDNVQRSMDPNSQQQEQKKK